MAAFRLEGDAHLYALEPATTIGFNKTIGPDSQDPDGGHGGGLVLFGPAIADIAIPAGGILENSASYGGGLAVMATGSGPAVARLFTVNATEPVVLSGNTASVEGGAVYVKPDGSLNSAADTSADLCAQDFRIDANQAPQGAAIYTDFDTELGSDVMGAFVSLNTSPAACQISPSLNSMGATPCASGTACNEISDNSAVNAQLEPSGGSILYFDKPGTFELNRFAMRGNEAGQLVSDIQSGPDEAFLSNCLLVDNHTQHELVHEENTNLGLNNCTFANNAIDNGFVFFADHGFNLSDSIVYEPGTSTIDYVADGCDGCFHAADVLSTEIATFGADSTDIVKSLSPLFADSTNADPDKRNYHLIAYTQNGNITASPAIDFAPPVSGNDLNLDGHPHDQDVPRVGGQQLDRDLGAYEAQPITDRIFGDALGDALTLLK